MKRKLLFLFTLLMTIILLPQIVYAKNIDKYLKDGKLIFKSIKPKNKDEVALFYENLFYTTPEGPGFYIDIESCNDDFTVCDALEGENDSIRTQVEIVYEYDENIKNLVESLVAKLPTDKDTFNLTEMELISFVYNNKDDVGSIADFSGELKKYIEYKNFGIDVRLGDNASLYTMFGGNALFTYNGTIYYNSDKVIHIESKHIFYIPTDSTNVIEAMKTRLQKNFKGLSFDIEEFTLDEFIEFRKSQLIDEYNNPENGWLRNDYATAEEYANTWVQSEYLGDEPAYSHVKGEEKVYHVKVNGKELREDFPIFFIVKKDSSKIVDNELITVDSESNITITTKETIPLDTLIQVAKITSGEEYNKIIEILKVANSEMFDLKLFSKSTGENITKLSDGTFKVKIPISDKFKGKELIVYFVDENNNIREYEVTIEGDYAIFYTNHFSIYTLAEKPSEPEPEPSFKMTYDFNGGNRQGESEYVDESVAVGLDITKANFIDNMTVTPPEGKELDAIEINGTRTELGGNYLLNKDTVFKYIWKDIPTEDGVGGGNDDTTDKEKTANEEKVPQTFDSIDNYIIMLVTSLVILIGTIAIIITRKKLLKNK